MCPVQTVTHVSGRSQSSVLVNYHFQSFRRPKSLSRFIPMQELPAQWSAKPLGSESFFDAVACSRAHRIGRLSSR